MLCELSNVDKHRSIHVVFHYAKSVDVELLPFHIIGSDIEVMDPPELKDNAVVLARVAIPRPFGHPEKVYVHGRTEHGVVIAETTRTPLAHFGMTIDGIKEAVEEAAESLRHFLP